jgi:hypothetical protein
VRHLVNRPLSYVKPLYHVYRSPPAVVFHSTYIAHRVLSSVIFVTLNCSVIVLNGVLCGLDADIVAYLKTCINSCLNVPVKLTVILT